MVAVGAKSKINRKKSVFIVNDAASQNRKNSYAEIDFSNRDLLINPGNNYILEPGIQKSIYNSKYFTFILDDICIYISLTKEENYDFKGNLYPGLIIFY